MLSGTRSAKGSRVALILRVFADSLFAFVLIVWAPGLIYATFAAFGYAFARILRAGVALYYVAILVSAPANAVLWYFVSKRWGYRRSYGAAFAITAGILAALFLGSSAVALIESDDSLISILLFCHAAAGAAMCVGYLVGRRSAAGPIAAT